MNISRILLVGILCFTGASKGLCTDQFALERASTKSAPLPEHARDEGAPKAVLEDGQGEPLIGRDIWFLILNKVPRCFRPNLMLVCHRFRDLIRADGHVKLERLPNSEMHTAMASLCALANLRSVDLSNCNGAFNLRDGRIKPEDASRVREAFYELTQKNTGLVCLNLQCFLETLSFPMDERSVKRMFGPLTNLQSLNVAHNKEVREPVLKTIHDCCPLLNTLDLTQCYRLMGDSFLELIKSRSSVWVSLALGNDKHGAPKLGQICGLATQMPLLRRVVLDWRQLPLAYYKHPANCVLEFQGEGDKRSTSATILKHVYRWTKEHKSFHQIVEDGLNYQTIEVIGLKCPPFMSLTIARSLFQHEQVLTLGILCHRLKALKIIGRGATTRESFSARAEDLLPHLPLLKSLILRDQVVLDASFWTVVGERTKSLDLIDASGVTADNLRLALLGTLLKKLSLCADGDISKEQISELVQQFPTKEILAVRHINKINEDDLLPEADE